MLITFQIDHKKYEIDTENPINIAIPMDFSENQPHVHGIKSAYATTLEVPGLIGDTKKGGSCNWKQYTITPHSHGTHTESIEHILDDPFPINKIEIPLLIPSTLITVTPQREMDGDLLITKESLEEKLKNIHTSFCQGIVIRTLPNDLEKMSRNYQLHPHPYFSTEAMKYLVSLNIHHLFVDIPSIDRMSDEGKLSNHRLFWNIPLGSKHLNENAHTSKTVTELAFIPNTVLDGIYVINLQIPNFSTDAAPSRPLLFPIKEHS